MRYTIIFIAFLVSCTSSTGNEDPAKEYPKLPNSTSVGVEGVAGSTIEGDTLWSYIINPTVINRGSESPDVNITDAGLSFIVDKSVFDKWLTVHGLMVYVVLEPIKTKSNKDYWYLTEVIRYHP